MKAVMVQYLSLRFLMRLDPSQYLLLVAFASKTGETVESVSETGYRIIECISQFA